MRINIVLWMAPLLLLGKVSCTSKHPIEGYNLSPVIEKNIVLANTTDSLPIKLELCSTIPFTWDNMVVLPPYYSDEKMLKTLNLTNIDEIAEKFPYYTKNRFPVLTGDEGAYVLLFVYKDRIIRYSQVQRVPLDFKDVMKKEERIGNLTKEAICNQLYLKKRNDTLDSPSSYQMFFSDL